MWCECLLCVCVYDYNRFRFIDLYFPWTIVIIFIIEFLFLVARINTIGTIKWIHRISIDFVWNTCEIKSMEIIVAYFVNLLWKLNVKNDACNQRFALRWIKKIKYIIHDENSPIGNENVTPQSYFLMSEFLSIIQNRISFYRYYYLIVFVCRFGVFLLKFNAAFRIVYNTEIEEIQYVTMVKFCHSYEIVLWSKYINFSWIREIVILFCLDFCVSYYIPICFIFYFFFVLFDNFFISNIPDS